MGIQKQLNMIVVYDYNIDLHAANGYDLERDEYSLVDLFVGPIGLWFVVIKTIPIYPHPYKHTTTRSHKPQIL